MQKSNQDNLSSKDSILADEENEYLKKRALERTQYKNELFGVSDLKNFYQCLNLEKLEEINKRLEKDESFRELFKQSPKEYLNKEGFNLPEEVEVIYIQDKSYHFQLYAGHIMISKCS